MIMQYLTARLSNVKALGFSVNQYFNLKDEPKDLTVNRHSLLNNAWATTGRHLREAMTAYGRPSRSNPSNKTK